MQYLRAILVTNKSLKDKEDQTIQEALLVGLTSLDIGELMIEFEVFYGIPEYPAHGTDDDKEYYMDILKQRVKTLEGEGYMPYSKVLDGYSTKTIQDFIAYCFIQWLQKYKGFKQAYMDEVTIDFTENRKNSL